MIISAVTFCSLHSDNIQAKTKSKDDYLTTGARLIPKTSSVVVAQRKYYFRLSLIPALNVTGEVAKEKNRKFNRTSQLNSRIYSHQSGFHRQSHTESAPRRLPWQAFIASTPKVPNQFFHPIGKPHQYLTPPLSLVTSLIHVNLLDSCRGFLELSDSVAHELSAFFALFGKRRRAQPGAGSQTRRRTWRTVQAACFKFWVIVFPSRS